MEDFERVKLAENERLKGNESMKCKDFADAIACYTRSLEHLSSDPATYSNRALAYLKTKEYARALEDAEAAIKLKPDYIKAYHRRGKAYLSMNKLELAIRDFQYILEQEPNNKEAITEIKNARKKLDDKLGTTKSADPGAKPVETKPKNKFVRVAIQEESDEDEEAAAPESFKVSTAKDEEPEAPVLEERKPAIEVVESKENSDWWKKGSETLSYDEFETKAGAKMVAEADVLKKQEEESKKKAEEAEQAAKVVQSKIDEQERKK